MDNSQPLKFGMARILSEETSPGKNNVDGPCTVVSQYAPSLSSLFKCCHTSLISENTSFLHSGIYAPTPLRPQGNNNLSQTILISSETNLNLHSQQQNMAENSSKRKRSWSRAVFSNLQRKGLEKRFQLQKYITKPDRRQLAATLGLTDAQVKVWFQNRRMKWRHAKESSRQGPSLKQTADDSPANAGSLQSQNFDSDSGSEVDVQTIDN